MKGKGKKPITKSDTFHKFSEITALTNLPTNEDIISLIKGVGKKEKNQKHTFVATRVAEIVLLKYQENGIDPGVQVNQIANQVKALNNKWISVKKNFGSKNISSLNKSRETEFKESLRSSFAVGVLSAGNPRHTMATYSGSQGNFSLFLSST